MAKKNVSPGAASYARKRAAKADASALASMNAVRAREGVAQQGAIASNKQTAAFAPGTRPDVITVSGNTVFSNGKRLNTRRDAQSASDFARRLTAQPTAAILGDQQGQTYRQLYKTDKGTQDGRANMQGINDAFTSQGLKSITSSNGRLIGNVATKNFTTEQNANGGTDLYVNGELIGSNLTGDDVRAAKDKIAAEDAQYKADNSYTAPQEIKTAPAVLTSRRADERDAKNREQLAGLTASLTQGLGSQSPMKPGKMQTSEDPMQQQIYTANAEIDKEYDQAQALITSRLASLDAATQANIEGIQASYDRRRNEARAINDAYMGGLTQAGIRSGRNRYAPEIEAGILSYAEQQGLQRLADLDAEELGLINEAQTAADSAEFDLLDRSLSLIKEKRQEKAQVIKDLQAEARAQEALSIQRAQERRELMKFERESASATIDAMVSAGVDPATLPEGYLESLDAKGGYAPGTSAGLFEVAQAEASQTAINNEMEQATKLVTLLEKLPVGETITIGGVEYTSLNKGEIFHGSEDDGNGNTTIWTLNQDTGEYNTRTLYGVSKKDGWEFKENNGVGLWVNPNTQEVRAAYDTNQINDGVPDAKVLEATFPNGYKPSNEDLAALGLTQLNSTTGGIQCGQYARFLTNYEGPSLSDFSAKKALIDKSIGGPENPPQAGDAFIQGGGKWGHIGIVLGSTPLEDGSFQLYITDANSKSDGTVRYREINSKNVLGFAREGFGLRDEFAFGSDSNLSEEEALLNYGKAKTSELTTAQKTSTFNSIVGKYNASPLVQAADRTPVLESSIKAIKENPGDGTLQLNLAYSYIQALDTYQSAVREGELGLVNSIDSKVGQLGTAIEKIQSRKIVSDELALQIADAAENILATIKTAAAQKAKSFASQANVAGVGDEWTQYLSGFDQSYSEDPVATTVEKPTPGNITRRLTGYERADGSKVTAQEAMEIEETAMALYEQGKANEEVMALVNEYLGY